MRWDIRQACSVCHPAFNTEYFPNKKLYTEMEWWLKKLEGGRSGVLGTLLWVQVLTLLVEGSSGAGQ
jgi:hypothetical protein